VSLDSIRRAPPALRGRLVQDARAYYSEEELSEFTDDTPTKETPNLPPIASVFALDAAMFETLVKHAETSKTPEGTALLAALFHYARTGKELDTETPNGS
jgi:hypothetical protein